MPGFRGRMVERVGDGGGWPDALAWAIFALLLTLLVVAIVSLALDAYFRSQRPPAFRRGFAAGFGPGLVPAGGALAVLGTRYARGEISRAEYLQARDDLAGAPAVEDAPTEVTPGREPAPEQQPPPSD